MRHFRLAAGFTIALGLFGVGTVLVSARSQQSLQQQMDELQKFTEKMLSANSPCPFLPDYRKLIQRLVGTDPDIGNALMGMIDALASSCTDEPAATDSARPAPSPVTPKPVPNLQALVSKRLGADGGCVNVTAIETKPWSTSDTDVETTLELRNGCGHPLLVETIVRPNDASSALAHRPFWFGSGMNSPSRYPGMSWPPNNPLPALGFRSLDDATSTTFTLDKDGNARATEVVSRQVTGFDVKIGACPFFTGDGTTLLVTSSAAVSPSVNTAFRDSELDNFKCVKVPPNDPSAAAKEWERILNGSLDKPAPAPAPTPGR